MNSSSGSNNKSKKASDNSGYFRDFTKLCEDITEETKHTQKTQILKDFLSDFEGDWYLLFKLLLPKQDHRVFQLKDKALIKVMSQVLGTDHEQMLRHLDKGDASETCKVFLMESGSDSTRSFVTLKQVDAFLDRLTTVRKQGEQVEVFEKFVMNKLTGKDMKFIARLIDKDLKLYAGIRYLLPALHPQAYDAFLLSNNVKDIVDQVVRGADLSASLSQSMNASADFDLAKILAQSDSEDDDDQKDRLSNKGKQKQIVSVSSSSGDKKGKQRDSDLLDFLSPIKKASGSKNMLNLDDDFSDPESDDDLQLNLDLDAPVNPDDDDELEPGSKKRKKKTQAGNAAKKQKLIPKIRLFQPIKPMLARASKSFDDAVTRCSNGFYMELKYDGERIQMHYDRSLNKLSCFSRNLKPVMEYKVKEVEPYIPLCIKSSVNKVILDGEILLIDNTTGEPLPFGTLGKHKKKKFKNATVCVFMFDILYYNGKSLLEIPLNQRRQLMLKTIKPIKGRILIGEAMLCNGPKADREALIAAKMQAVIQKGEEGLVIKDLLSIYEPNARHWLKMKRDYLKGMADSADLLVLGAYFGTGSKGGLMSVFLMGCLDEKTQTYKTVCKCGNGHDDQTIEDLNQQLKNQMVKISKDYNKVPSWLDVERALVPDFVIKDPTKSPVWEISGGEYLVTEHYSSNISIRFPRVTKIRDDKDADQATTLRELVALVKASSKKDPVALEESIKTASTVSSSRSKIITTPDDSDSDHSDDDDSNNKRKNKQKQVVKSRKPSSDSDDDDDYDDDNHTPVPLEYVWGDISKLSGSGPKLIVHSVDDSGRWSKKGSMGLITDAYGKDAMMMYRNTKTIEMGSIQTSPIVQMNDSTEQLYVCNMVSQQFIKQGEAPAIDYKQLEVCLHRIRLFLLKEEKKIRNGTLSVHLSRFHHAIPNLNWTKCEKLITSCLSDKGIPVIVYTKDREDAKLVGASKKRNQAPTQSSDNGNTSNNTNAKVTSPLVSDDPMIDEDDGMDTAQDNDIVISRTPPKQKEPDQIFSSVSVVISGYDKETTEKLTSIIVSNGGHVQDSWVYLGPAKTTHLITETKDDMFDHVSNLGGIIVTKNWVLGCELACQIIPVHRFLYSDEPQRDASQPKQQKQQQPQPSSASLSTNDNPDSQKLLDVFTGCTVYLFGDVQKRRVVKRYLVAYNADLLDDFDEDLVTHVITDNTDWTPALNNMKRVGGVHIVRSSWVWQSVNQESKVKERDHYMH